jgi:hypothetical protein
MDPAGKLAGFARAHSRTDTFMPLISDLSAAASPEEISGYRQLVEALADYPVPDSERIAHLSLFQHRSSLYRILLLDHLYKLILPNVGVIMEFGVRWGRDLAVLMALRTIYEPYNFSRKILGFDTFEGFPSTHEKDGTAPIVTKGALNVSEGYQDYLSGVLSAHEKLAPRSNLKKFELVRGDVSKTLPEYLQRHPETIVALAYFDVDLYEPTAECLRVLEHHVVKGSVIAFDELAMATYPGETRAFLECSWLRKFQPRRLPMLGYEGYIVIE